jgi:hypothetical protein
MAKARKSGLRLLVWNVPPGLARVLTRLELSRIEQGSTTFWRFFPDKQFQPREVEAVARQLRELGLKVTSSRSAENPLQHLQHVINKRKQSKNRQLTARRHASNRREWAEAQQLVAVEDEGRRNRSRQKEFEEQERIRALQEQRKLGTDETPKPISLNWRIFPPGSVDEIVKFFSGGFKNNRGRSEEILRERVETFKALNAEAYIRGIDGFDEYIGAKFSDNLVVFENWRYGNALYILYENWKEISRFSRFDLLRENNIRFDRVIHRPGWQRRLEEIINRSRRWA